MTRYTREPLIKSPLPLQGGEGQGEGLDNKLKSLTLSPALSLIGRGGYCLIDTCSELPQHDIITQPEAAP